MKKNSVLRRAFHLIAGGSAVAGFGLAHISYGGSFPVEDLFMTEEYANLMKAGMEDAKVMFEGTIMDNSILLLSGAVSGIAMAVNAVNGFITRNDMVNKISSAVFVLGSLVGLGMFLPHISEFIDMVSGSEELGPAMQAALPAFEAKVDEVMDQGGSGLSAMYKSSSMAVADMALSAIGSIASLAYIAFLMVSGVKNMIPGSKNDKDLEQIAPAAPQPTS